MVRPMDIMLFGTGAVSSSQHREFDHTRFIVDDSDKNGVFNTGDMIVSAYGNGYRAGALNYSPVSKDQRVRVGSYFVLRRFYVPRGWKPHELWLEKQERKAKKAKPAPEQAPLAALLAPAAVGPGPEAVWDENVE